MTRHAHSAHEHSAVQRCSVIAIGPLPPPVSGGSIAFREVCDDLARNGINCRVINISPAQSSTIVGRRVVAARVRSWLGALATLHTELSAAPASTVYLLLGQARSSFARDLLCVAIGRWHDARIVGHVHGGCYDLLHDESGPIVQKSIRLMVRQLDRVVVLGESLRGMLDFEPSARTRLTVVPNGLPSTAWSATAPRHITAGQPLELLFLSNLIETKGYLDLISAAALLRKRGVDVRVHLAGEFRQSPDDERVRSAEHARVLLGETVRDLGMDDVVTLHGAVDEAGKRALLQRCHMLVLPTRYRFEGQPIAIIEALAAGLPVVSTRFRAIPDIVQDRVTGVLVDDPSPEGLCEVLCDAVMWLAQPDTYNRASQAALDSARESLGSDRFLDRMRAVLAGAQPSLDAA